MCNLYIEINQIPDIISALEKKGYDCLDNHNNSKPNPATYPNKRIIEISKKGDSILLGKIYENGHTAEGKLELESYSGDLTRAIVQAEISQ